MQTTLSPSAVIKESLDKARAGKRGSTRLMSPPPADLLEDLADLSPRSSSARSQGDLSHSGSHGGMGARSQNAAPSATSSTRVLGDSSGNYAAHYGPVPSGSVSVPGVSMPAHFMMAQAPHSDLPGGTSVTSRSRAGRPPASWAAALLAFGLFVGVGAFSVMHGDADAFLESSATFVDPSRAANGSGANAKSALGAQPPVMSPAAAGGVVAASPAAPAAPTMDTASAPLVSAPVVAAPMVATPAPPPVAPVVAAPAAAPVAAAPAAPRTFAPARPAPAARPASRPAPAAAPPEDAPPPKATAGKSGKPGKAGGEVDEETRKALEILQKSQLESSF